MRSAHRRARWVLATAGSVTLALSSLAQTSTASDTKILPEKATPEKSAADINVSPAVSRLVEIKVELAWLGDRATFPCQLAARRVGGKLEVGGFVPDESLRTKAIEIAKANSELPVVDKLLVHAGSAMMIARASHEELSRAAAAVLGRTLAKHGEPFSFETESSGEITITGLIPTWEDKLTVSRRLSQVPGCTGVVNHFRVRNQMTDGKLCNLVSTDGKLRVPAPANAVVDLAAPKPPVLSEPVQRVEVAGALPLLPAESPKTGSPSAVVQAPTGQQNVPPITDGVSVNLTPVVSKPIVAPAPVPAPVVNAPAASPSFFSRLLPSHTVENVPVLPTSYTPGFQSKPLPAQPVVIAPAAPTTVVLKKEAAPVVATPSTPAATTPVANTFNTAPLKLSSPVVFGNSNTAQQPSTVANVVVAPPLPAKPVATASTSAPAKSLFAMQLGNPARTPTPAASPIQQVSYQEPASVSRVVTLPVSQPAASPYGSSPYGGSPYHAIPIAVSSNVASPAANSATVAAPASGSPYAAKSPYGSASILPITISPAASTAANSSSTVRPASGSPYGSASPYGAASVLPITISPVSQPAPAARVTAPVSVSSNQAATPAPAPKPVQVVKAAPVTASLAQPSIVVPAAPVPTPVVADRSVAPKMESQVPAILPSNVVAAPVMPVVKPTVVAAPKPVTPSGIVQVSAQRPAPATAVSPVTAPEVQGFLSARIAQLGQGKIRDLRIEGTASNACVISLVVPTAADGQQLGQKIINMPELVPYKVDLQVRVQP